MEEKGGSEWLSMEQLMPMVDIYSFMINPPPQSLYIESSKAVQKHTCSLHIWRDEKSKFKGHKFGFFKKGNDYTQVFVSWLLETCQPMP